MRAAFPKIYQSFAEFEREELHKLDSFTGSIDSMLSDSFTEELDFDEGSVKKSRRRDDDED